MSLRPGDSPLRIRRSILIAASPERIWREFALHSRMNAWWGNASPRQESIEAAYAEQLR